MGFSRNDFDRDTKALVSAFEEASKQRDGFEQPSFALCDWRRKPDDWNGWYLFHPPVTISSGPLALKDKNRSLLARQDSDESLLEEKGIFEDDQCFMDETNGTKHSEEEEEEEEVREDTFQWTFHIVYSTTYQSPVLYFSVQDSVGNPVGRQLLLQVLGQEHKRSEFVASNDFPTEPWEFLSQEEHPITGMVSFFLHPCQSAQRLKLLTTATTAVVEGVPEKSGNGSEHTTNLLWTWMSMILPAVGHSVPSVYFRRIQEFIARQP